MANSTDTETVGFSENFMKNGEYQRRAQKFLEDHQEVNDFIVNWLPHINGDKDVFATQLVNTIYDCLGPVRDLIDPKRKPSIKSKVADFEARGIELLQALVPNLEEDTLLALRFLYYVKAYSVISDERYDQAERAFINRPDVEDSLLMSPGSDCKEDYPDRVTALAFYLMSVNEERRKASAA